MPRLFNLVNWTASTQGTVDFILGGGASGARTPSQAGVPNGKRVTYTASQGNDWEVGGGKWNAVTNTLARDTVLENSVGTTARINFTAPPRIIFPLLAQDLRAIDRVSLSDVVPNLPTDGNTNWYDGSFPEGSYFRIMCDLREELPIGGLRRTVTFDQANDQIIWDNHGFKPNDCVAFWTTGNLPTNLKPGVRYYVIFDGLTRGRFKVTTVNLFRMMFSPDWEVPTPVYLGPGTVTGTAQCALQDLGLNEFVIPPGTYNDNTALPLGGCGVRRARYIANGCQFRSSSSGSGTFGFGRGGYEWLNSDVTIPIESVSAGAQYVVVKDASYLSQIAPGVWVCFMAGDMQNQWGTLSSWPPNAMYHEYHQVADIDVANRRVWLGNPQEGANRSLLKNGYLSTWPVFVDSHQPSTIGGRFGCGVMVPMGGAWGNEVELVGGHHHPVDSLDGASQIATSGRLTRWVDWHFNGQGLTAGSSEIDSFERCTWEYTQEIDKLIGLLSMRQCKGSYTFQSACTDQFVADECRGFSSGIGAKRNHIKNSTYDVAYLGPAFFGAMQSALIENCNFGFFDIYNRLDNDPAIAASYASLIDNYTFTGGVLSCPMRNAQGIISWVVPGRFVYFCDHALRYQFMGRCFRIYNFWWSGTVHTVTWDIPNSRVLDGSPPANDTIVSFKNDLGSTWAGSSVPGGYFGAYMVHTGVYLEHPYYVVNSGVGGGYQISETKGGSPVTFSGSASGTSYAIANPTFNVSTSLKSLPRGNSKKSTLSINIGTGVLTWNGDAGASNPVNDDTFVFQTTGALPTGFGTAGFMYYVVQASGATFKLSTSKGGSAVSLSGSQSGTHTGIANPVRFAPLACPRITVRDSGGCITLGEMSGGPENIQMYSYVNREFKGFQSNTYGVAKPPKVWGKIEYMEIDVVDPDTSGTSSASVTITANSFNDDLTKAANFSCTVNLKTAGLRRVTSTDNATGGQTGDTLPNAFGRCISELSLSYTNVFSGQTFSDYARFFLRIKTDQGVHNVPVVSYVDPRANDDAMFLPIVDTVIGTDAQYIPATGVI